MSPEVNEICNKIVGIWYIDLGFLNDLHALHSKFAEMATKYCDKTGTWFRHPESNRTWSNYTRCNSFTNEKRKVGYLMFGTSSTAT